TASFLPLLGIKPILGRGFHEDEVKVNGDKVVILSHSLWIQRFGGKADALGKTLKLNDETYTIIGIMPAGFSFPSDETVLWIPLDLDFQQWGRGNLFFDVIGRLKTGVGLSQAEAEMKVIAAQLEKQYPDTNTD